MRGKVSVLFLGVTLCAVSGCANSSYIYPNEARQPTGNTCCYAYDDYPPYTNNYYDPSMPYGVYRGRTVGFHAHGGFTGEIHPGYRDTMDWSHPRLFDGEAREEGDEWVGEDMDENEQPYAGRPHHHHKKHHHHHHKHWQNGNAAPESSPGAGQNENYGRENGHNDESR